MTQLLLDQAFPQSYIDVVNDCKEVGANAAGLYVLNRSVPGSVRTADFITNVINAGVGVLPIIVPSDNAPSIQDILNALSGWNVSKCPVVLDIETGSSPPASWVDQAINALTAAGFQCGVYCNPSSYAVAAADAVHAWKWRADWTYQRGDPPPGWQAWQYANNYSVNGHTYDISTVIDDLVFFGANMSQLDDIQAKLGALQYWLETQQDDPTSQGEIPLRLRDIDTRIQAVEPAVTALGVAIASLEATVAKISQPTVDATAVAVALAANQTLLSAIASAVAKTESKDLAQG